jgi:hypothetical protein
MSVSQADLESFACEWAGIELTESLVCWRFPGDGARILADALMCQKRLTDLNLRDSGEMTKLRHDAYLGM